MKYVSVKRLLPRERRIIILSALMLLTFSAALGEAEQPAPNKPDLPDLNTTKG